MVSFKWRHLLMIGAVLASLYLANFIYAVLKGGSGGTFGDTFGAVNALFSGSALLFLVLAFLSQREELKLLREERDDTKALLNAQVELNELQKLALAKQIFEQSYNSLLQIVISEKARIQNTPTQHGNRRLDLLAKIGLCSDVLLENVSMSSDREKATRDLLEFRTATFEANFLINCMIHLATMVDQSCPEPHLQPPFRQLVSSIIDPNIASAVAWQLIESRLQGSDASNLEQFCEAYRISEFLRGKAQSGFNLLLDKQSHH